MELRVIGCHGGETPKHRTSAFLLDDRLAIDAGSLTSGIDLKPQCALEAVLVSHSHMDHVRDLATLADNRNQRGAPPLAVAGTRETLQALREHFFNGVLWPDFTRIPSVRRPTLKFVELRPEVPLELAGFEVLAVPVNHSVACCGFLIRGRSGSLAYSGDTGPTDRLWDMLNDASDLKAILLEVSFPNADSRLARLSGHHTPETMARDLAKLRIAREIPTLLYHIKPSYQARVERECARLRNLNLTVCSLDDRFVF